MRVCGLVDLVVSFRLEKEMPGLTAHHGEEPTDERGKRRTLEHHAIRREKAQCANHVQRLVDAAVMIVTVIVPALRAECLLKGLHIGSILVTCTRVIGMKYRNVIA